jgi:hypothetical protein
MKIQLFRRDGDELALTHIASLRPSELAYLVNGVRVAYCKQHRGGVSCSERLDAVIQPIKQCACAPQTPQDEQQMRVLGCIVSEFIVRLEHAGATVFEQTLPMKRLTPVAYGIFNLLRLNESQSSDEPDNLIYQLTADFLTPMPAPRFNGNNGVVVMDELEPLPQPAVMPRPHGRVVGNRCEENMTIYVRQEALDAMLRHAQDAPDDLEIGGALLGQVARDEEGKVFVVVEETPLLSTQGSHYSVSFGWQAFRQVRERLKDERERVLLGLWHVHPPSFKEAFASQQDVWGFQTFFAEPWNVFAVVGRTLEQTAFFEWMRDGQVESVGFEVT